MNNSRFLNIQNASIVNNVHNIHDKLNFVDENVSLTFSNITVANNTINIQDNTSDRANLFSFQYPAYRKTIVSFADSYFKDNKVTMSMIKIYESFGVNLKLTNNTFSNNFGLYGSAIVSIINISFYRSWIRARSNLFQDNYSAQKGGVFFINIALENITLLNNIYINNSAQQGGVGYTGIGNVLYYEDNGTYIGNITSQLFGNLI